MAEQAQGGQGLYAQSTKCIPMGMPFQMSIVPFPLEFIITAKTTFVLFEVTTSEPRRIYIDPADRGVSRRGGAHTPRHSASEGGRPRLAKTQVCL